MSEVERPFNGHATVDEDYECSALHEPCPVHRPVVETKYGRLRVVLRDGAPQWLLTCPGCGQEADIDSDQFNGRVSVDHTDTGCSYHETHDFNGAIATHPLSTIEPEPTDR